MPKAKTNRAAMKRFRKTKNGKFKRNKLGKRHLMVSKSPKRRRQLRRQHREIDAKHDTQGVEAPLTAAPTAALHPAG